jgi:hypothetical protein
MCHILRILFQGFTAADVWLLIIELVVVALIADERIRSWRRNRRAKQLLDLISKGEDLRDAVPTNNTPVALQEKWASEVRRWTADATELVRKCRPYAWKIFQRNRGEEAFLLPPTNVEEASQDLQLSLGKRLRALQRILGDEFTAGWF